MELRLREYQSKLIKQVYQSFTDGYKKPLVVLPTGGGKTALFSWMASSAQDKGKQVWFLVHRKELLDQTVETFNKFDIPLTNIHIAMVSQWKKLPSPNLIVLDEAHHSSARTWKNIFKAYPDTHIIGLTATPARLDGKPLGELYDCMVEGPTTQELIDLGFLSNYKVLTAPVELKGLKVVRGDFDQKQAEQQLRSNTVYANLIDTYKEHAQGKQAIYFCTTVEHSQETAEKFRQAGIKAEHFDGGTPKNVRTELVNKFRNGEIQILCNVALIGEGFDMPACDVVGLVRPTASLSVYLQQVGRCLRPAPDKTAIIIDHVGNISRHGFPTDPRAWSLKGKIKTGRTINEDGSFFIRQCKECFSAYEYPKPVCPVCGAEYESEPREIKQMEAIKLVEVEQKKHEEEQAYLRTDEAVEDAETYSDFCAIAKARGYKTGWAWHQAKMKGVWVPY